MPIQSLQIEKHVLAGIIKHQQVFVDLVPFICQDDFNDEVHKTIFLVIKSLFDNGERYDKITLAEKIKNIGISFKDDINIYDYIDNLSYISITPQATIDDAKELIKIRVRRNFDQMGGEISNFVKSNGNLPLGEIVGGVDAIYGKKIDIYTEESQPQNLFEGIEEMVEERGNNPLEEVGLKTPHPEFNRLYGGFKAGQVYAFASRPGQGKALEGDTLIPVPHEYGFSKIKDLKIGSFVFAVDGSLTRVIGKKQWQNRKLYKVTTGSGEEILADENHEWLVKIGDSQEWKVYETKELAKINPDTVIKVPRHGPLNINHVKIKTNLYHYGQTLPQDSIPNKFLRTSIEQRKCLLAGITKTFGTKTSFGKTKLSLFFKDIALSVGELIATFGVKFKFFESTGPGRFHIVFDKKLVFDSPHYKFKETDFETIIVEHHEQPGDTICIEVGHPSHLFLCGRSMIATHNSSFLEDIAYKTSQINKTRAFVCDTEMATKDIQWRTIAAKSGVPQWYIETGNWRRNEEMVQKVRAAFAQIKEAKEHKYVTHYHVGNKSIEQVISMVRRWHSTNIKNGETGIIVYDYLKLTSGESVTENWAEYQVMGQKIDKLKRLAEDLQCVVLTAIQVNRSGENHNRRASNVTDDSSAIAISDRLQWFAAFVAILRRKTIDEITLDTTNFGTHKLIPLKTRFQGRDAAGHQDLIRRVDVDGETRWVNNYLNFNISNFEVTEMGSLSDILESQLQQPVLDDVNQNDGRTL